MVGDNTEVRGIKTTKRVFQIIEFLKDANGAGLTETAGALDISKSTTYRHLASLQREGYVVKEKNVYYPAMKFLALGEYVRNRKPIYEMVRPKVEQLAKETDERAEFIIEEHGQGIFVHQATGANAVLTDTHTGKVAPLHAIAAGKAILAYYSEERVEEIIEKRGLPEQTPNTITDPEGFHEELERIRETSVAYNRQEFVEGLCAVGVSVRNGDGNVLGALSVTGPTNRLTDSMMTEDLAELLRGVANELELNVTYS